MKKRLINFLIVYLFFALPLFSWEDGLLTRAEKSGFTETTRYQGVIDFLNTLQKNSTKIKLSSIGFSTEGREIPFVILGDPVPVSPAHLILENKPVIYIQANIHAGEVEGKEAILMLMREILLGKLAHLLDNQILLITPIFNPDGNEKISPSNRRNQVGPDSGVGVRFNGQSLDLNRDFVKLESPENNGAAKYILNRWDPMLLIDLHTTNGSYHQEPLTYATAHNPNGDPSLPEYVRNKLFPKITNELETKYKILSIPYGTFADALQPEKGWQSFDHQPYYSTNYWGLRNRFSILNENYAYADFKTRIEACYHFIELILEYTDKNYKEMQALIRDVDQKTVSYGLSQDTTKQIGVEFEATPFESPLLIRSYEFEFYQDENGRNRVHKTDTQKNYRVPFYGNFKISRSIILPKGYFFSANLNEVAEKLLRHGILVERLVEPAKFELQVFQIKNVKHGERIYQGHLTTRLEGEYLRTEKELSVGTYYVGLDQPLANLAAYLLEAESDGGLVYWNFFDRYLYASQWGRQFSEFPVYRLLTPQKFARQQVQLLK